MGHVSDPPLPSVPVGKWWPPSPERHGSDRDESSPVLAEGQEDVQDVQEDVHNVHVQPEHVLFVKSTYFTNLNYGNFGIVTPCASHHIP